MEKQKEMEKVKTKNYEAGMNIGRTCYKLFLKGHPFSDYEEDILVLKQAKAKVGQLNHSRKFPSAFLPHVAKEVESRIKKFLTSKLVTGHHFHSLLTRPADCKRRKYGHGISKKHETEF